MLSCHPYQGLGYIFFFYAASFVLLGVVCFTLLKRAEDGRALSWWWMGFFGLIHGLNEWMDMVALFFGAPAVFRAIWLFVMALSFIFLMEFARRGTRIVFGRTVSVTLYIWLLAFASWGMFAGWPETQAILRFFFGFLACAWSAVVLWFYRRKDTAAPLPKFSRLCLKTAAVAMFLVALTTGLMGPPAAIFPANIFNADTFCALCKFPIQVCRGAAALVMAVALGLYAIRQGFLVFIKEDAITKRRFIVLSVLCVLFSILLFYLGWEVVDRYSRRVEEEEKASSVLEAKIFAQFVKMTVETAKTFRALAEEPEILEFFEHQTPHSQELATRHLEWFCRATYADFCYAVSRDGAVFAAAQDGHAKTLVGRDEGPRDYFQRALAGDGGVFFIRSPEEERGIYSAFPVYGAAASSGAREILGITVAVVRAATFEDYFRLHPAIFLADPRGVVFAAGRRGWISKTAGEVLEGFARDAARAGETPGVSSSAPRFVSVAIEGLEGWRLFFGDGPTGALSSRFVLTMTFLSFFLLIVIIVLFIFGIFLDSLRLAASEAVYKALVEGSADAIQLFDNKGRCISVNENGLKLLQLGRREVLGRFLEDLWPKEYKGRIQEAIGGVLSGTQEFFEARRVFPDSTALVGAVTLTPIFESSGRILYFVGICRDATEEHRSRERLMQSCKMETVYALATGVCHEFNNVLEIILGNAELAAFSADAGGMRKALAVIAESAKRGGWIVKTMVDLSGKTAQKRDWVDAGDLLKQNLSLLSNLFSAENITVETSFQKAPRIYANPGQLSQVFVNIMMNARDAMAGRQEKKLTVSLERAQDGGSVVVILRDTGRGIKEEIKPKIFGPFVTTKGILGGGEGQEPGTGLGLFIAYGIIKQHNGTIVVESEEGKGAAFTITLPVENANIAEP